MEIPVFYILVLLYSMGLHILAQRRPVERITDELKVDCVRHMGFDSCTKRMDVKRKTKKDSASFHFSDEQGVLETNKAWDAVANKKDGYSGPPGQNVTFTITAKEGQIFLLGSLQMSLKNCKLALIRPSILFGGAPAPDVLFEDRKVINKTDIFTRIKSPKYNATSIELLFILDQKKLTEGIIIKTLVIKACKQEAEIDRDDLENIGLKTFTTTKNRCLTLFSTKEDPNAFTIDDNDPHRDEKLTLEKPRSGGRSYVGAPGKNVELTVAARDGGDFEWWKICMQTKMASTVEFHLHAADVTYVQVKQACDCTHPSGHSFCFAPWDRDITVSKAVIVIKPCKGSNTPVEVRKLRLSGCRDHWHHNYVLHTNPGDYRILTINSIRNETITVYGAKDSCGNMLKSEIVHYTDNTGNVGDNITIIIGEDSLVRKILTEEDSISFNWIINKAELLISVLSARGTFQSDIRLDLENRIVIKPDIALDSKKRKRRAAACPNRAAHLNVLVKQCRSLVPNVLVFANILPEGKRRPLKMLGRETRRSGMYDIILPKAEAAKNVRKEQCDAYMDVESEECQKYSFITRERYRFICKQVRFMLDNFTSISQNSIERARIHEACDHTFLAMNAVCRITLESAKPNTPKYFDAACESGENFSELDLYKELGNNVEVSFFFRDKFANVFAGKTKSFLLDKTDFFATTISANIISLDVFAIPETPFVKAGYQVSIHFNCAAPNSRITMFINSAALGRTQLYECSDTPNSATRFCSCCNFIIGGADQVFKFDIRAKKVVDYLKIRYLQRGLNLLERDYFLQVQ